MKIGDAGSWEFAGGGMDWKGNAGGRGSVERFATIMRYFTD